LTAFGNEGYVHDGNHGGFFCKRSLASRERLLMKTTNVSNARKTFAQLLESVIADDEPIIIVRYREPIAAIVPISRLQAAERAAFTNRPSGRGGARRQPRRR
jgi:prevent-host-death family protein